MKAKSYAEKKHADQRSCTGAYDFRSNVKIQFMHIQHMITFLQVENINENPGAI